MADSECYEFLGPRNLGRLETRRVQVYLKVEEPRDGQEYFTGNFQNCTPVPYDGDYQLYEAVGPVEKTVYRKPV
jgi:hypothetical protein